MTLPIFKLEDYMAEREFKATFMFGASDVETHSMAEIVAMADKESLDLWSNLKLGYTEARGSPVLREEISKLYGGSLKTENVLCFAGAEEGIFCMSHALLTPQDHAIVITPCYQSLEAIPASLCDITKINILHTENWQLDVDRVRQAIRPNTKLLIINFPHNPTGAMISPTVQQELISLARQHDIWLFSDEVYRLLELAEADCLPTMAAQYEKGFSLGVMSKAYGLAGLRIGWIACQNLELLQKMSDIKHYLSICNSGPSEILALMALRSSSRVLVRNHKIIKDNISLLDRFFKENSELFEWVRPKGGCVGFPRFKANISIANMAEQLMDETGVLILPGDVFEEPGNHFRMGFGRKNMPEALNHFYDFIKRHRSSWKAAPT